MRSISMNQESMLPPFLNAWDACVAKTSENLPPLVLDAVRRNVFDTVAALAAGTKENCTRAALSACQPGTSGSLSATDAALVLGTASHALDYDDVCMLATCHPSAPVVAALIALQPILRKERPDLDFLDWLGAYALGTETLLRLGQWLGFRHYALGFHATSTLGVVGVAAAAAHVLGVSRSQSHAALAIAASSACGLRANFGSDTKPLHVGFAASAGLRAVLLARAGAGASNDVWSPQGGFALAFNGGEVPVLPWSSADDWALETPGFEHKRFPSCYMTHRLIAGVLEIRGRHPLLAGELVQIDIEMPQNGTAPLKHPHPSTGLQAKFSGQYCAAVAWINGKVSLESFTDEAVQSASVNAQLKRVNLHERTTAGESLDTAPVRVTVMGDGWTETILVDWAPGSIADPMTREDLHQKWQDCAKHGGLTTGDAAMMNLLDTSLDTPAQDILQPLYHSLMAATTHTISGTTV